jgi:ribonuclease D
MYISSHDELVAFCDRAKSHSVLAVDTEFLREKTYHPWLCLIQVATKDEAVAIDPLLIDDLSPLADLLVDKTKTKVFHACGQDLEVIYDSMGILPEPVFDTQVAAAFLGHRMQLGYGALVQAYEGVRLPKADGLTDWSKRPLDEDQLQYAEDDVLYLPRIYERMMSELVARDRLSWLEPELAQVCDVSKLVRQPEEAYLHLKRSSSLTRRQLAVAREVCAWRERAASRRNLPRKWVLSDEIIVELCRRAPTGADRLRRIRGTEQLSERDVSSLLQAVHKGERCKPENYPSVQHRAHKSAEADGVIDLMYALLRIRSEQCGVAIPLIATRDDLHEFAAGAERSPLREGWRYEVVGSRLEGLLAGEVGLTVKDGRIEIL